VGFVMKVGLGAIEELADAPRAKYVVVSAITPTPLGEGKTTTTVGIGQGFKHIGKRATVAIRQPSMGPTFGIKGGAAGGGYSQVVPMERLNLHLTGDMHAITAAHNLLAAMIDNQIHHHEALVDRDSVTWRRVLDVSDRVLRNVIVGLGTREDGVIRQTGFDITAASEVMAIEQTFSACSDPLVTCSVKVYVPATVATPAIPALAVAGNDDGTSVRIETPVGRAPDKTVHVYTPLPPVAVSGSPSSTPGSATGFSWPASRSQQRSWAGAARASARSRAGVAGTRRLRGATASTW